MAAQPDKPVPVKWICLEVSLNVSQHRADDGLGQF